MLRDLIDRFRRLTAADLRWSFLIVGGLVAIGAVLNAYIPHGWTVWPFVAVAGMLVMLNESTDRNGEGIPPMRVYALFFAALAIYSVTLLVVSRLNLFVLVAGLVMCAYYVIKACLTQRAKDGLIATRLAEGLCVHCGLRIDPSLAYCAGCGEEPNPSAAQRERIGAIIAGDQRRGRMRALLPKKSPNADTRQKEMALISRRNRRNSKK